jgi:serine phosphatase RsbU (regulator of sigma subunit)
MISALLKDVPLFAGFHEHDLQAIAHAGVVRRCAAHEVVFCEGDRADGVYVVLQGRVRVVVQKAGAAVEVASLGPGGHFGELALLDGTVRSATIICAEDSELFFLDQQSFATLFSKPSTISRGLLSTLTTRVRDLSHDVVFKEIERRALSAEMEVARLHVLREQERLHVERLEAQVAQERLKAENARFKAELAVSRRLQFMGLPSPQQLEQIPSLQIAGYMEPVEEVGGDYYDVVFTNGTVWLGIGDVTGHGLESGVLMLMVQTAVRTLLAAEASDPCRVLEILNRVMCENVQRLHVERSLTLSLMAYRDGVLVITGQHEEVIISRCDGRIERIDTMELGFPLGLEQDIRSFIARLEVELMPGDVVVLYTDGITEADNPEHQQYGIERLCEVVGQVRGRDVELIKQAIVEDLMTHVGRQRLHDDIAFLVIKRTH